MPNIKNLFNVSIILLVLAMLPQVTFAYKEHAAADSAQLQKIDIKVGTGEEAEISAGVACGSEQQVACRRELLRSEPEAQAGG